MKGDYYCCDYPSFEYEVGLCVKWIKENTVPTKTIRHLYGTSYRLKHLVEDYNSKNKTDGKSNYVSAAAFTEAALRCGLKPSKFEKTLGQFPSWNLRILKDSEKWK